jgi:hypothetical protein
MASVENQVETLRRQLERVLASPGFARSERLSRLLRFVVERHLQGRDTEIKESLIAIEVFGRQPDYDPKLDSIVRSEAARLRSRLIEYYAGEGSRDPVVIDLPKGGYTPRFRQAETALLSKPLPQRQSGDGFRTLQGPEKYSFVLPQAEVHSFDDRGEPISRMYVRRSVVELKNGDLLATAYGHFEKDTFATDYLPKMFKTRAFLLRSKDQGRTWSYVSTIASGPVEQEGFGEPVMVQLRHGSRADQLVCHMRTGRETPIYQCESDDEGKTWTKAFPLQWTYSRFGRSRPIVGTDPDLIEMEDGTLVMAFGHKPDYQEHGNYLAFSVDHGHSWTQVVSLSATVTRAYCGVREVSAGELFVVYTTSDANTAQDYSTAKFNTMGRSVRVTRLSNAI